MSELGAVTRPLQYARPFTVEFIPLFCGCRHCGSLLTVVVGGFHAADAAVTVGGPPAYALRLGNLPLREVATSGECLILRRIFGEVAIDATPATSGATLPCTSTGPAAVDRTLVDGYIKEVQAGAVVDVTQVFNLLLLAGEPIELLTSPRGQVAEIRVLVQRQGGATVRR
jgi:hypothetical protein